MLKAEVTVAVTREEHHQAVLARYPVFEGTQRQVAVELGWCVITSGKYRGGQAIEVRLDGARVGELTYALSQRYAPMVTQVTGRGGAPGCEAVIRRGAKGLEMVLRLPHETTRDFLAAPPAEPAPRRRGIFALHRALWIGGAVVAILVIAGLTNNDEPATSGNNTADLETTTAAPATTTSTTAPSTAAPVTEQQVTTRPPAPEPKPKPKPKPVPQPATEAPPEPVSNCDPNYGGCVPIASDVDCAGGSGNGPAYVAGPVEVLGSDHYGLDSNDDGIACED